MKNFPEPFFEGQVVSQKYTLVDYVGEGGISHVFLAKQTSNSGFTREVVLKFFKEQASHEEWLRESIRDQAELYSMFKHPNLITCYDASVYQASSYLVLEYVNGASLADVMSFNQMNIKGSLAIVIVMELLKALESLHQIKNHPRYPEGLFHADVSAQNVLLEASTGRVILTDFGVQPTYIRSIVQDPPQIFGNPWYMPPEQALAEPLVSSSDIYNCGVLLYELLLGKREKLYWLTQEEVLDLSVNVATVDRNLLTKLKPELFKILSKSLERDSSKRYQTPREMFNDLQNYITATYGSVEVSFGVQDLIRTYYKAKNDPNAIVGLANSNKTSLAPVQARPVPAELDVISSAVAAETNVQEAAIKATSSEETKPNDTTQEATKDAKEEMNASAGKNPSHSPEKKGFGKTIQLSNPGEFGTEIDLFEEKSTEPKKHFLATPKALIICGVSAITTLSAVGLAFLERQKMFDVIGWSKEKSGALLSSITPLSAPENPVTQMPGKVPADAGNSGSQNKSSEKAEAVGTGQVNIDAVPWARIEIKGANISDDTPLRSLTIPEGTWSLVASYDNCKLEKEITVQANSSTNYKFNMRECR